VRVPSAKGSTAIGFAFVDGYLLFASSANMLSEAIRLHQTGESLGKSRRFQSSLPAGKAGASALLYYDQTAMMAMRLQQSLLPSFAESVSQSGGTRTGAVVCFYGDDNAIREASISPGMDVGVVLIWEVTSSIVSNPSA
jgi:hypothetical protein